MKRTAYLKYATLGCTVLWSIYGASQYIKTPPIFVYEVITWCVVAVALLSSFVVGLGKLRNAPTARKALPLCHAVFFLALILLQAVGKQQHGTYMIAYGVEKIYPVFLAYLAVTGGLFLLWARWEQTASRNKKGMVKCLALTLGAAVLASGVGVMLSSEAFANPPNPKKTQWYAKQAQSLAASADHFAVLNPTGSVTAKGDNTYGQCNVKAWKEIVAVAAGNKATFALQKNGTVVMAGENPCGQEYTRKWKGIVQIVASGDTVAGLQGNGKVLVAGKTPEMAGYEQWQNIKQIAIGEDYLAGLRENGTVVVTDVALLKATKTWNSLQTLSGGSGHLTALTRDGTTLATGESFFSQCEVNGWNYASFLWAGDEQTVLAKSNGTLIALGKQKNLLKEIAQEKDIAAIAAGNGFAVIKKADGRFLVKGTLPKANQVKGTEIADS